MSDNWTTISSLATAGGTLVLGVATFAAVRSANRAARVAERAFQIGLRPILAPSRLEDPPQRIMFVDRHWVTIEGGRAAVEVVDGIIYLAMQLRNVGNGIGIIESWNIYPRQKTAEAGWADPATFRTQTRGLWVPPADVAFWQGALRDREEPIHQTVTQAIHDGAVTVDLLYRDHEGGQRTVSRFTLIRRDSDGDGEPDGWWVALSNHHRPDDR